MSIFIKLGLPYLATADWKFIEFILSSLISEFSKNKLFLLFLIFFNTLNASISGSNATTLHFLNLEKKVL